MKRKQKTHRASLRSGGSRYLAMMIRGTAIQASLLLTVASCYSARSFHGDGELIDHGFTLMGLRYEARVSEIRLDIPGTYSFRLANLPSREFCLGFDVNAVPTSNTHWDPYVDLTVASFDEIVIDESGTLREWNWSFALGANESFIYRRGDTIDGKGRGSTGQATTTSVNADQGYGSCFEPRYRQEYFVTVRIRPTSAEPSVVWFVARSFGA